MYRTEVQAKINCRDSFLDINNRAECLKINKLAVQNKHSDEISCKKSSNMQDLIDAQMVLN